MSGQLQNEDHKSEAELIAAGGSKAQLLNDTKVYVTGNGINETLDDAFATGKLLIAKQIATPASPAATYNRIYPKSDDKWYTLTSAGVEVEVGSGSGGSGGDINYVTNPNAALDTSGWAVYADAAGVVPVDGTGGSPTVTLARNTTTPLRGTADFLFTKDAASRQGEGTSYSFTINKADQSKPLRFSFDYSVSANYSYTNNDLVFYIYDVTNAVMIQPTPYVLDGSGRASFEFQSNAGSVSYRLIMHVATTNASAWTMNFVNVKVSPTPAPSMLNVKDKQYDLTVTGTNWTTVRAVGIPYKTKEGAWRLRFNIQGAVTSGSRTSYTITVSGVTFKTSSQNQTALCTPNFSSSAITSLVFVATGSNTMTVFHGSDTINAYLFSGDVELDSMPTWAVDFYPVSLSDGAETRVVALEASKSLDSTGLSGLNTIIFDTVVKDTHAAYNPSTGTYTVLIAGQYEVSGLATIYSVSTGTIYNVKVYKNGVIQTSGYTPVLASGAASDSFTYKSYCNVGDTLLVKVNTAAGTYTLSAAPYTYLNVSRTSGPATIAASEKVYARYSTAAGQAITTSTTVNYGTKDVDSHNAVTTGASWKFTAPSSGFYNLSGMLLFDSAAWNAGTYLALQIIVNGVAGSYMLYKTTETTNTNSLSCAGIGGVYLNAGNYISLEATASRGSTTLTASARYNWIVISKGN